MENLEKQIIKLEIVFAKKPILKDVSYEVNKIRKKPRLTNGKGIIIKEIEPYLKITSKSNLYIRLEDRLFYSETLSLLYRVQTKEVKENLMKYILEGITVSEDAIETIVIKPQIGTYHINDIFEIVGDIRLTKNFKDL